MQTKDPKSMKKINIRIKESDLETLMRFDKNNIANAVRIAISIAKNSEKLVQDARKNAQKELEKMAEAIAETQEKFEESTRKITKNFERKVLSDNRLHGLIANIFADFFLATQDNKPEIAKKLVQIYEMSKLFDNAIDFDMALKNTGNQAIYFKNRVQEIKRELASCEFFGDEENVKKTRALKKEMEQLEAQIFQLDIFNI